MAKRSYDQRLKDRWIRKEEEAHICAKEAVQDIERMMKDLRSTRRIIYSLFRGE